MLRTLEVLLCVLLLGGALLALGPLFSPPTERAPDLEAIASSALAALDRSGILSELFEFNAPREEIVRALNALLPPNVGYRLTAYEGGKQILSLTGRGWEGLTGEPSSAYLIPTNITFSFIPEKIAEAPTLYILNCSDAIGWWITGTSPGDLAAEVAAALSPYFERVVIVNNTNEFNQILMTGVPLRDETVRNAVVFNVFGEAVPIPSAFCDPSYPLEHYFYTLGRRVRELNWTWVNFIGYPFYYVSNALAAMLKSYQNGYGIYGMVQVGPAGLNAFLQGIDGRRFSYDPSELVQCLSITANLTSEAMEASYYYGVFPSPSTTCSRLMPTLDGYHLNATALVFNTYTYDGSTLYPGACFVHSLNGKVSGRLITIGGVRGGDIRYSILAVLLLFRPEVRVLSGLGPQRLIVLEVKAAGGVT